MEKEFPEITVDADVYNAWLISSKILRSVQKEDVPVTINLRRSKSIEIDITRPCAYGAGRAIWAWVSSG